MSLSVGIIGLPNVGKSTLFNALAARKLSPTAAHPFTTIEPHEAVVGVPDERLEKLAEVVGSSSRAGPVGSSSHSMSSADSPAGTQWDSLRSRHPPIVVPATVTFIDIAGLVRGAHKGEGLGNQFLAKIREVDAIIHVVRAFEDPNVVHVHGAIDPKEDIEVVNLELELGGITEKPTIYVVNVDESRMSNVSNSITSIKSVTGSSAVIVVCARLEEELADLDPEERKQYLKELGIGRSGLEQLIEVAYKMLGLITFYTIKPSFAAPSPKLWRVGDKASEGRRRGNQVTAWALKRGKTALDAAAQVHTDFARNFIKAEVINVDDLLEAGSWNKAKEAGKVHLEGRDYKMSEGDVVEFKVGA